MSVGAVNKQTGERIPTAGMPAIDSVLSGTSTNPVQNRVVKAALDEKVDAVSGKGLSTNDYSNTDKAKVDASLNVFTGTQAAWAQLSTAEKKTYQRADFTDDYDNTAIGDLTALHTSAKSSIVNAINEVADGKQNSTDNNLQTTAKTIVGGINEVKSGLTGYLNTRNATSAVIASIVPGANIIPINFASIIPSGMKPRFIGYNGNDKTLNVVSVNAIQPLGDNDTQANITVYNPTQDTYTDVTVYACLGLVKA